MTATEPGAAGCRRHYLNISVCFGLRFPPPLRPPGQPRRPPSHPAHRPSPHTSRDTRGGHAAGRRLPRWSGYRATPAVRDGVGSGDSVGRLCGSGCRGPVWTVGLHQHLGRPLDLCDGRSHLLLSHAPARVTSQEVTVVTCASQEAPRGAQMPSTTDTTKKSLNT